MQKFNLAVVMMVLGTLAITPKAEARNLFTHQPTTSSTVTAQIPDSTNIDDASTYLKWGFRRLDQNNYEEESADFSQAIKLEPNNAYTYLNRGLSYFDSYHYSRAKDNFEKALEIDPKLANAYYFRGITRIFLNDSTGGITDLRQASTLFRQEEELELAQRADNIITQVQQIYRNVAITEFTELYPDGNDG